MRPDFPIRSLLVFQTGLWRSIRSSFCTSSIFACSRPGCALWAEKNIVLKRPRVLSSAGGIATCLGHPFWRGHRGAVRAMRSHGTRTLRRNASKSTRQTCRETQPARCEATSSRQPVVPAPRLSSGGTLLHVSRCRCASPEKRTLAERVVC